MLRKVLAFAFVLVIALASVSFAAPVPPSKGQWAWPLESSLRLYEKADRYSEYSTVKMPAKWLSVPSAVRDDDNYLWYKVSVNGKTGWLPQNGIRLKMGGKSKSASNLYKNYVKARNKIMSKPGDWSRDNDDGTITYTADDGEFRVVKGKKSVEDVYFQTSDGGICKQFFGTDLIGMYQSDLRKKLGTPTMRETPFEDPEISILSFELADKDLTLSITERREDGDDEGQVITVELYKGRTGSQD